MAEIRRLPALREGDWDWQLSAACRGLDTASFYHPENERGPSRMRREMRAKAVCSGCPVIESCLQWALESGQDSGVWGGLSEDERRAMKRRAARNRARQASA